MNESAISSRRDRPGIHLGLWGACKGSHAPAIERLMLAGSQRTNEYGAFSIDQATDREVGQYSASKIFHAHLSKFGERTL